MIKSHKRLQNKRKMHSFNAKIIFKINLLKYNNIRLLKIFIYYIFYQINIYTI